MKDYSGPSSSLVPWIAPIQACRVEDQRALFLPWFLLVNLTDEEQLTLTLTGTFPGVRPVAGIRD